jgi:hypothetical protein
VAELFGLLWASGWDLMTRFLPGAGVKELREALKWVVCDWDRLGLSLM